jgi:uncharacterized membrane-anchored protein
MNTELTLMIYVISLTYLIIVGVIGLNYALGIIFRSKQINVTAKVFGLVSLLGLGFVAGVIPYAFIGTYVIASVQTRNHIRYMKNKMSEGKGDDNDDVS